MEVVPHTDAGAFARLAHPLLEPDPVRHTSILTVLHGVHSGAFDPTAMLTVHENGGVVGALLRTAGHPALVSAVPPRCAGAVVEALVARDPEEVDGEPVAQAAARAVVAGMSRIGPVYTPPEHRGRGYAAAVTAAAARWALGSGARHVLLYTDLANPTTNRLSPRLGFRPRYDALELRFARPRSSRSLQPGPARRGG